MKRTLVFSGLLTLALSSAARAAGMAAPALQGPAARQLRELAAAPAPGAEIDGAVPRREGPLTILDEKPWEERIYHPASDTVYHGPYGPVYGPGGVIYDRGPYGPYPPGPIWRHRYSGPYVEVIRGTEQKVRIDDRGAYERGQAGKGALWGALAGLILGGLLALAAPAAAAAAIGAAAVLAGAAIGAATAASKPDVFERVVNQTTSYEKP